MCPKLLFEGGVAVPNCDFGRIIELKRIEKSQTNLAHKSSQKIGRGEGMSLYRDPHSDFIGKIFLRILKSQRCT